MIEDSQKTQTALEPTSADFAAACSDFLIAFEYWTKGTGAGLKANCDRIESSLAERPPKPTNKGYIGLSDWVDVVAYPIQRDLLKLQVAAVRLAELPQTALDQWEFANTDHLGSFGDQGSHTVAGYACLLANRVSHHLHNLGSAYETGGFAHNRLEFDEPWQKVLEAKFSKPELDLIVTDVSVIQTLFTEQFLRTYAELDFAELSSQFGKEFKRVRAKQADRRTEPAPKQLTRTTPASSIKIRAAKKPRTKKPTADDLMKAELVANLEEVKGFTAQQWADKIGRAKSTVIATPTWKSISLARKLEKAEKAVDRRRK